MILSFDTALGGISICISRNGEPLASFADPTLTDQAARLVPVIEAVLVQADAAYADLDGLAVTLGPGGFTGVRIGLATARALAFATNKPLLGFTTLELIAEACSERPLIAALPAGRGMFYVQFFGDPAVSTSPYSHPNPHPGEEAAEPLLLPEAETFALAKGMTLSCIHGAWLDRRPLTQHFIAHDTAANAALLARLAHRRGFAGELPEALPLYIRPPDAKPQTSLIANIIAS